MCCGNYLIMSLIKTVFCAKENFSLLLKILMIEIPYLCGKEIIPNDAEKMEF
jgi:hypothetical protein